MTTANDALCGAIHLRAQAEAGVITGVDLQSTRPTQAARMFVGKPVETLCSTVGQVFSLCGVAQTIAALTAAEAALGISPAPGTQAARSLARQAEMLTQTTMRLGLHWPRALGLEIRPDLVRACLATEAEIASRVLGPHWRTPGAGVGAAPAALDDTLAALDTLLQAQDPGAPLSADLAARGWESYGALPDGQAPEAGALSRTWAQETVAEVRAAHGAGLAARLEASRTELSLLPLAMLETLAAITPESERPAARASGVGEASVETARGPLTHRLSIENGMVTACVTQAPTEANFAPDGPAVVGLIGAVADPVAAELHVLGIDPCVGVTVEIAGA